MIKIYFDMDGTIADLYGMENWLDRLHKSDPTVFDCQPIGDLKKIIKLAGKIKDVEFGIITWLPMGASPDYEKKVEQVKRDWTKKHFAFIKNIIALPYGTPKHKFAGKAKQVILFDDNEQIRQDWNTPKQRKAYSEKEIIQTLTALAS